MNCPKCNARCKRRRAGEFYCSRHGDMPKPQGKVVEFIGPPEDFQMRRLTLKASPKPNPSGVRAP